MVEVFVGRVFSNENGEHGNPVGIIIAPQPGFSAERRTEFAAKLGFSETVFIDDEHNSSVSFYTKGGEIDFAGHAAVGAADFLSRRHNEPVKNLNCRKGPVEVLIRQGIYWVVSPLLFTPPWNIEFVASLEQLEGLSGPMDPTQGHCLLWSWIDESQGLVRARTFAPMWNIPEDEANGSGCMQLAAALGRELRIVHGKGSIVLASNERPGYAAVGGNVYWDNERPNL